MMNGGQPIDPGLIQALGNVSTNDQDQQNLRQQLAMAQQLRQPMPSGETHMAGKVAIRNSPLAFLGPAISNYTADQKQSSLLGKQAQLSQQLRDTTGKYMSAIAAQQNPQAVHPDSQAALGGSSVQNPYPNAAAPAAPDPTSYEAQPGEMSG